MRFEERVPEALTIDNHYIGRPADFHDRIVLRRINLVKQIPGFLGKDKTLLDIGCGNGASMFLLSGEFRSCLGLEIFEGNKEEFENYKLKNNILNCEFNLFDVETEKMDLKFDRLISFEVIEHLKDDKNVKFYYDILKPGGMAAISVPNKWWIFETHGANLPLLPWNRVPFFSWLPCSLHEKYAKARIYTAGRIRHLLEGVGFKVRNISYITAPMDVLKEGKLKSLLVNNIFNKDTTHIPFLATSLFVIAEK